MIVNYVTNNVFMSLIVLLGVLSVFLQWIMTLSLKGYVKASSNMKTTKKKVMINLKNQFEAMYEMNSGVKNMDAYVDKYLLKLRFLGITYSGWEKLPYMTAGAATLAGMAGAFYGYINGANDMFYAEIIFAYGITLACLFVFFHIFGIKSRKQQIHIQLVDYLENYLANRLTRTKESIIDEEMERAYLEGKKEAMQEAVEKSEPSDDYSAEEDMDMLKRLIREMDSRKESENAAATIAATMEMQEQSDIELLEEFVQSFLS